MQELKLLRTVHLLEINKNKLPLQSVLLPQGLLPEAYFLKSGTLGWILLPSCFSILEGALKHIC